MATYKEIKGTSIEVVSSDPSNPQLGQIWYNTTSQTLKGIDLGSASWATGGNLGTARRQLGGAGTQTAGLAIGGDTDPGYSALTEEYNGSSWTAGGALPVAKDIAGSCGTQTAGLSFAGSTGGGNVATTEEYDGSSWTGGGTMNTARIALGSCGTQTAGLGFGGPPIVTGKHI